MLRNLLLAVIVVLLLELGLLVWMLHLIGWGATVGIGLVTTVLGGAIAKRERQRVWRDWQAARASGQLPAADAVEPMLVVASGALLMFPGFLTDLVGLLLLLPPLRRVFGRWLWPRLQRSFGSLLQGFQVGNVHQGAPRSPRGGSVIDTDGEAIPGSEATTAGTPRTPPQLH
jgi:UPF0716 family protein affecting phage T7 exclusion